MLHLFQTILSRKAAIQERIGVLYASQDFLIARERQWLQEIIASADCMRWLQEISQKIATKLILNTWTAITTNFTLEFDCTGNHCLENRQVRAFHRYIFLCWYLQRKWGRYIYLHLNLKGERLNEGERENLEINNEVKTRVGRLVERGQHRGQIVTPQGWRQVTLCPSTVPQFWKSAAQLWIILPGLTAGFSRSMTTPRKPRWVANMS